MASTLGFPAAGKGWKRPSVSAGEHSSSLRSADRFRRAAVRRLDTPCSSLTENCFDRLTQDWSRPAGVRRPLADPTLIVDGTEVVRANEAFTCAPGEKSRDVWFSRFHDAAAFDRSNAALAEMPQGRDSVAVELSAMVREPQTLRLEPTARSLLHD